jgi:4-amino-4-deoxy-L-arabinose transferase-like glycosyltransferase
MVASSMGYLLHKSNVQRLIALLFAIPVLLSACHHRLNFWGLPWTTMVLLILVGTPALALLISLLLNRIWRSCLEISGRRWLFFLLPAVMLAAIIAWRAFSAPVIWHELQIVPSLSSNTDVIQLKEIKVAHGYRVPFLKINGLDGWIIQDGLLTTTGSNPSPIKYSFLSPIDKPVSLTFLATPHSGSVTVLLDGKKLNVELDRSKVEQKLIVLDGRYRLNINSEIIISIVVISDLLAFTILFTLIWLIQEINQNNKSFRGAEYQDTFLSHRLGLIILITLSLTLHLLNYFSVPLIVVRDSPSYLQGAVHWIQYKNLDGVSSIRGPGTTFLFAPLLLLFGRNPWGFKLGLHLLAILSVPVSYRLGWQLSGRRWFAFLAGLIAVLTPDLLIYSNIVMSEVPNVFFSLLFCTLLISALETFAWVWLIAAMLAGSFCVLLRPENIGMLSIGTAFLLGRAIWNTGEPRPSDRSRLSRPPYKLGLSIILAAIPLLAWSAHNYRLHNFFGISNYAGEVLYDGWVYFGESSHIPITDTHSEAVRIINKIYKPQPQAAESSDAPTGWEIYTPLRQAGYTTNQAISILREAAIDSIRRNPSLAVKLLFIKLRDGLDPETTATFTFPLYRSPDKEPAPGSLKAIYFDDEDFSIPWLIRWQRMTYDLWDGWYKKPYQYLVWFCLAAMVLCLYRKPFLIWAPFTIITAIRIIFPTILGISHWRYVISGIIPLQIMGLAGLQSLGVFFAWMIRGSNTD